MSNILNVDTEVIIIGDMKIKDDDNTIYELTLIDGKTYSVVFCKYDSYEGLEFRLVIGIKGISGDFVSTPPLYFTEFDNSITNCIETDRRLRSEEE